MFPHYEFRFQLTTNYCEACLLEDATTTGVEFFRLHWLLLSCHRAVSQANANAPAASGSWLNCVVLFVVFIVILLVSFFGESL
jgi:hypothetical protein